MNCCRFRLYPLLLCWLLAPAVLAQDAAQCPDPGASLLWEVTGGALSVPAADPVADPPTDRDMTLHLFGSIHVGKPAFYPLHPRIEQRFSDAEHLVFEVDPAAASDPQAALRLQLRGMLPQGQTLRDLLSPEAFDELDRTLTKLGASVDGFLHVKPWLMTLMLANFQANALGYNALYGLELYFNGRKAAGTTVHELESLDQQIDMLDSLDDAVFLDYALDELDTGAADMQRLVQAWECADHEALSSLLFASLAPPEGATAEASAGSEALFETLFSARNRRMADRLESYLATGTDDWFVVVGAAHLLGEGSVVDLLRSRGYRVTPVRLD